MSGRRALAAAAILVILAEPASALGRRTMKPRPSAAVLEMRAQRVAARAAGPETQTCAAAAPAEALTVVFAFDSDEILETTGAKLDRTAAQLACRPDLPVVIAADGDNHGGLARQQALAARRAEQVRQRLLAAGIAPERLATAPFGSPTPDAAGQLIVARGRGW